MARVILRALFSTFYCLLFSGALCLLRYRRFSSFPPFSFISPILALVPPPDRVLLSCFFCAWSNLFYCFFFDLTARFTFSASITVAALFCLSCIGLGISIDCQSCCAFFPLEPHPPPKSYEFPPLFFFFLVLV